MRLFENPSNGYRERVSFLDFIWALIFGIFFFSFKGIWNHVFIQIILVGLVSLVNPIMGFIFGLLLWLAYAILAPFIVSKNYLRKGWKEVPHTNSSHKNEGSVKDNSFNQVV